MGIANYAELAKGQMLGGQDGFLKIIFSTEDFRILGVHAIGEGATEIVHIGQVGGCMESKQCHDAMQQRPSTDSLTHSLTFLPSQPCFIPSIAPTHTTGGDGGRRLGQVLRGRGLQLPHPRRGLQRGRPERPPQHGHLRVKKKKKKKRSFEGSGMMAG